MSALAAAHPSPGGLPPWAVVTQARQDHIRRVVELLHRWSLDLKLPCNEASRWCRAGWLHDALRDADEPTLRRLSRDNHSALPLLHGPAAAARAASLGESDAGILSAVKWHTTGRPEWQPIGRALYCADLLEPGRKFNVERRAELVDSFVLDPDGVFREVVRMRAEHETSRHRQLMPETLAMLAELGL